MTIPTTAAAGLTIGSGGVRQLRKSLLQHAPDAAITILQESGFASGEGLYQALCTWLVSHAGVQRPDELDATQFSDALSDFFLASGWGRLTVAPVGGAALALDSTDWIEAEPGSAQMPMCFFSSGMLADLLSRVSGEQVAVMEVECRSRGDGMCRFLTASPATLQEVYEKMTAGRTYVEALGAG
jgi:bacteriochlorophyll 4-vinyl reductase